MLEIALEVCFASVVNAAITVCVPGATRCDFAGAILARSRGEGERADVSARAAVADVICDA